MPDALSERRNNDLRKLEIISRNSGGKLRIIKTLGNPFREITLELKYKTAVSDRYPHEIGETSRLVIELSSMYPLTEPIAKFETAMFNPNVYDNGRVCFGWHWVPSEGIELLVARAIRIMIFDRNTINVQSPANALASIWYENALRRYPRSFPTENVNFAFITNTSPLKPMIWERIR